MPVPPPPSDRGVPEPGRPPRSPLVAWVKRLGVAGFVFFLVKGILWLVLPGLLVTWGLQCG